jgi:ABC-type antimicrobial peptide transport system permease subunit
MTWVDVPLVFRPIAQQPPLAANLVVHTRANDKELAAALQKQIASLDANVPVGAIETMDDQFSRVLAYPRFRALVLGTFAGLALLLAGIGLYGVLAQSVAQRTQEFGVRLALGAGGGDVLRLVVRQGVVLTCAGLAAGLVIALGLTRFLSSLLYGVRATDPWIWCGVSLVLALVAVVATSIPAWRAARVDPMTALRYE